MATDETAARPSIAFPQLEESEIATLRKFGTLRRLQDGEILVAAGDPGADFFVVLAGAVEIVDPTGDQPRRVAMHGPGQFTGSVSLLKQWRTVSAAVARGETEVLHVPTADLRRIIVDQPALGEIILKAFIARSDLIMESGLQHPRLIGSERSRSAFEMREFLTRNQVPFTWLSVEAEPEVAELLQRFGLAEADMPAVVRPGPPAAPSLHPPIGPGHRAQAPAGRARLRPGGDRRRAGGPGRRRLWLVRGPQHPCARQLRAWRAGGRLNED